MGGMIGVGIEISGLDGLRAAFNRLTGTTGANVRRALVRIGDLTRREAADNAPCSPTMKILSATLRRKRRTARRTFPGGLEKSIEREIRPDGLSVAVFVASNSYAGKYARRIHDLKGVAWFRRGPGTVAKGPRADEKFVERAIRDNESAFLRIIQGEIDRALRSAN